MSISPPDIMGVDLMFHGKCLTQYVANLFLLEYSLFFVENGATSWKGSRRLVWKLPPIVVSIIDSMDE